MKVEMDAGVRSISSTCLNKINYKTKFRIVKLGAAWEIPRLKLRLYVSSALGAFAR